MPKLMADSPPGIQIIHSAQESVEKSDVVVFMRLDDTFANLSLGGVTLIDS